jgi:hypothetical protein
MTYPQQPQYAPPQGYAPPAPPQQPTQYAPPTPAPQFQQQPPQTGQFFQQDPNAPQAQQPMPQQYAPPAPPAPASTPQTDTADFFGGGAPWVSWDVAKGYQLGSWYGGQVLSKSIADQTDYETGQLRMSKFHPGQTIKQLVIEVQTSMRTDPQDDGKRNIAVKSALIKASKDAYEAVGAADVEIGGWYYASKTGQEQVPSGNGRTTVRRNTFKAIYARPGSPDPAPQPMAHHVGQPGTYPQQQYAPGPIAAMPAQQMANSAQAAQHDPAVQAAVYGQQQPAMAQADQQAQFAAWQAQQAAQGQQPAPPQYAQPGGQPATAPQPATPQPGEWTPFAPS